MDSGAWVAHGLADGYDDQLQAGDQAVAQLGPDAVTDAAAVLDADRHARVAEPTAWPTASRWWSCPPTGWPPSGTRAASAGTARSPSGSTWRVGDGNHVSAVPADADLDRPRSTTGTDPVLAAHQVLAALALVSLDHSGSQACVRQPGQPCRRGVAVELPADAGADQAGC